MTATTVVLSTASRALSAPPADQAPLTVHVITPDRDNVPGAVIAIEQGGRRTVLSASEHGVATVTLATGTYGLVVSKTGYLTTREHVELPSSGFASDITLSPASTIFGRATFNGRPVAGVSVTADCRSETRGRSISRSAETDDQGEYHLSGLPVRYTCTLKGRPPQLGVVIRPLDAPLAIGDRPSLQVDLSLDPAQRAATPAPPSQSRDGRSATTVNGLVVEKGTRRAIPLASILILDEVAHTIGTAATTDVQGHFQLALAPGQYRLFALRAEFESDIEHIRGQPTLGSVHVTIPDNSQQNAIDVELPLTRGAVIAGRVLHVSGQPLVGATVRVYRTRSISGHVRPLVVETRGATSTTDENGQFRLYGLRPGTYLIAASESSYDQQGSWRQYYPGGGIATAQSIEVSTSGVLNADITWAPEQMSGVIQGTVTSGDGSSVTDMLVTVTPSSQSNLPLSRPAPVHVDRSGHFTVTGLDEGSYVVKAASTSQDGASAFGFARTSTIGSTPAEVTDVTITTAQARAVTGRVVSRGPDGVLRPVSDVSIAAFPADADEYPDGAFGASLPVGHADDNGAFTIRLLGGRALFRLTTPSEWSDWYIRAVSSTGGDVTDVGFAPVSSNASIVVELARQISPLSGTVKTKAGQPAVGASVVMLSSDPSRVGRWSRFAAVAQCAPDGTWSYNGLPPGQYFVFSAPHLAPEEVDFEDLDWLQTYLGKAKLVTVSEDSTTQLDLQSDDRW